MRPVSCPSVLLASLWSAATDNVLWFLFLKPTNRPRAFTPAGREQKEINEKIRTETMESPPGERQACISGKPKAKKSSVSETSRDQFWVSDFYPHWKAAFIWPRLIKNNRNVQTSQHHTHALTKKTNPSLHPRPPIFTEVKTQAEKTTQWNIPIQANLDQIKNKTTY